MGERELPDGTILIHIGPKKTGTTALQRALGDARERMRHYGVSYPGRGSRSRAAAWDVTTGQSTGTEWQDLVREVRDADAQRVVVCDEKLADATISAAHTIIGDLGGDSAHVTTTVRRFDRLLPSQWQQRVQAGMRLTFDDWLRIILGQRPAKGSQERHVWRHFWRQHNLQSLVERFVRAAGVDRVSVIIADEGNPDFLPRTFEQLLGLPEGLLRTDPRVSNRSLSQNEVEFVRQINVVCEERGLSYADWELIVHKGLIRQLKRRPRQPGDDSIVLPPWALERVQELNEQRMNFVQQTKTRVIGDPSTLRMTNPRSGTSPAEVHIGASVAAAGVGAAIEAALKRSAPVA